MRTVSPIELCRSAPGHFGVKRHRDLADVESTMRRAGSVARGALAALLPTLAPVGVLVVLGLAVWSLRRQLHDYPWHRLGADVAAIGPVPVLLAVAATVASYLAMTGYDALALRYVEHPMPYRRFAAASLLATAFGNSLGASAVVGTALRARVYSAWAVPGFAITRIAGFNLVTLSLGSALLAAAGVLITPDDAARALRVPLPLLVTLAVTAVAAVVGYLLWCGGGKPAVSVRNWRIDRPSRRLATGQVVLSCVEWLLMAAVLYALVPRSDAISFPLFAAAFVLATTAGLVSNVPGGLGVFESVLLVCLGPALPADHLVTALVAYRLIYYLVPLAVAAVLLAVLESRRDQASIGSLVHRAGVLTPSVIAFGAAVLGVVLVLTGDVPGGPRTLDPATFTASVTGVLLLLLARGLHRRLRGAWVLTIATLVIVHVVAIGMRAMVFAVLSATLVALLVLARGAFHRSTSVLSAGFGWAWVVTVAGAFSVIVYLHQALAGLEAGGRTWLAVSAGGDAPVPLRIGLAAGVASLLVAGTRLASPLRIATTAGEEELRRVEPLVAQAMHGDASLVWTGDKRVLLSADGTAFLMYQVEGRSWVVMGDPVGEESAFDELLWRFLDECDRNCGRPVFYCVHAEQAERYRRLGLSLVKLGEEAVVDLATFSMQGSRRAKLRSELRAAVKLGCSVEVLAPEEVRAVLPELRAVSERWLTERNAKEKSFSLGAFDEQYLVRFPVAVARQDGEVVAFASLWASGGLGEVKVDLMRRRQDAPRTVMSQLFVESMLWAQAQGYGSFSLGMAPLSGLRTDGAAPFWDRVGHFLFSHGEHFYNFQGLRQFKDRFDPQWQTRHVASRGGAALPVMMLNVATLVGGGVRGIVAR